MSYITEKGKTYEITGTNINAFENYAPPDVNDGTNARGTTSAPSYPLKIGDKITVNELTRRVEQGLADKSETINPAGATTAAFEVVWATVEGMTGQYYVWVVYNGVVKVKAATPPAEEQPQDKPADESQDTKGGTETGDARIGGVTQPSSAAIASGTEVEVRAGQTLVLDVKADAESKGQDKTDGAETGGIEVELVDEDGRPYKDAEVVHLIGDNGIYTVKIDKETGKGTREDILPGEYDIALQIGSVHFEFDKELPTREGQDALAKIANRLITARGLDFKSIRCVGYADKAGSKEYNDGLCLKRAIYVKNTLSKNQERLREGYINTGVGGELPGDSEEEKKANRRVDVLGLFDKDMAPKPPSPPPGPGDNMMASSWSEGDNDPDPFKGIQLTSKIPQSCTVQHPVIVIRLGGVYIVTDQLKCMKLPNQYIQDNAGVDVTKIQDYRGEVFENKWKYGEQVIGTGFSLGFYNNWRRDTDPPEVNPSVSSGKAFFKFNPPLKYRVDMDFLQFTEEAGGNPYAIRVGNQLEYKISADAGFTELTEDKLQQVAGDAKFDSLDPKSVRIKDALVIRIETGGKPVVEDVTETPADKLAGNQFSWVEIMGLTRPRKPGIRQENWFDAGDPKMKPGVDIPDLTAARGPMNIFILLDISGSMADNLNGSYYRTDTSKKKPAELKSRLYYIAGEKLLLLLKQPVGSLIYWKFTAFYSESDMLKTISTDRGSDIDAFKGNMQANLDKLTNFEFKENTPLKSAVISSVDELKNSDGPCKVLIVVTDGDGSQNESLLHLPDDIGAECAIEIVLFKYFNSTKPDETAEKFKAVVNDEIAKKGLKCNLNFHIANDVDQLEKRLKVIADKYRIEN